MKLTKAQEAKTLEVTTSHDYDEKYMVILKEGYTNDGVDVEFFNTQKEVKEFINGAELVEVAEVTENETTYSGFYANELFTTNGGIEKVATAMNGKFYEGFTEMRFIDLQEGVEGAHMLLDVMLKELVKHKQALRDNKQVNIHLEWTLSEDRSEYTSCKFVKAEIVEKGE